jgi:predicted nucleotidyltransferase
MWKKYNGYKVVKLFFDDPLPDGGFGLREISRKTKIASKSVKIYLDYLIMEGVIRKNKNRLTGNPVYYGNRDSEIFKLYKKLDLVSRVQESGLLDYLYDKLMPDVIVLFGSGVRGEDIRGSDIDLFFQCNDSRLDLIKFEKKLNRKINIFFAKDFRKLSKELKNNINNGIILKGYLKVF